MHTESDISLANNRKRRKHSIIIYTLSLGVGLIAGIAYLKFERGTLNVSNNAIIAITALLSVFLYYLTLVWYRGMDEFERLSFDQAGNIAFHLGFLAFPWYVLHRLKIVPMLDAIVLMCSLSFVFLIVYYYKKFK